MSQHFLNLTCCFKNFQSTRVNGKVQLDHPLLSWVLGMLLCCKIPTWVCFGIDAEQTLLVPRVLPSYIKRSGLLILLLERSRVSTS